MQHAILHTNLQKSANQGLCYRIGINIGDVVAGVRISLMMV